MSGTSGIDSPLAVSGDRWQATVDAVRAKSDEELRRIVEVAPPHALRMCLYQLTGDERCKAIRLSGTTPGTEGASSGLMPTVVDAEDIEWLRRRTVELLASYRDGAVEAPLPSLAGLHDLLAMLFGFDFPSAEDEFWWEEFAAVPHPRGCDWFGTLGDEERSRLSVVVVGAGMNGLTTAMNLKQSGIDYTVIERGDAVGGVWNANRYPGARVDFISRSYSYTWEPGWPWEHVYALGPELRAYMDHVVDTYGLRPHIRFGLEVTAAHWDESSQEWELVTQDRHSGETETIRANVVVAALGLFSEPRIPEFPGMDDFEGPVMHTARWDPSVETGGKRIASIGTGSSGVQIVGPLSEEAGELFVFQRSGTWVDPVPDYVDRVATEEQWLLDHLPYYLNWQRILAVFPIGDYRVRNRSDLDIDPNWEDPETISASNKVLREKLVAYMMEKIGDRPDLVAKCLPRYPPATKRLPKDNGWFDALRKDHVHLVSDAIERFTPKGIRTVAGDEYEVDVIVLATGFRAGDYLLPIDFVGRDGLTIAERWQEDGARAYLGMTIPGFPNLFCLYGPNTNGRSNSPCGWGEMQSRYAMESIKYLLDHGYSSMDVREEVYDEHNELIDELNRLAPWMDRRQTSYYRNEQGRSATNGPFFNREYWPWTRRPNPDDYRFTKPSG